MLENQTELVFIIDESGSMSGLETDTLGGYNRLLNDQKKLEGECLVTTIFFNNLVRLKHDRTKLSDLKELLPGDYAPGGTTALYDAIGFAINKTSAMLAGTKNDKVPSNVLVVIITDGEENASRTYSQNAIKQLISAKEENGWVFNFLGANIDTIQTAETLGIRAKYAHSYTANEKGIQKMYAMVSDIVGKERKKKKK